MQNIIIGFVERLHDRGAGVNVSIADAVKAELAEKSRTSLLKLREAADDLHRIIDLELGRRDEVAGDYDGTLDYNERISRRFVELLHTEGVDF